MLGNYSSSPSESSLGVDGIASFSFTVDEQLEICGDRVTRPTVKVLDGIEGLDPRWVSLQRLIQVERSGTRSAKRIPSDARQPFHETVFYISSLTLDAAGFARLIRQHWHIENRSPFL